MMYSAYKLNKQDDNIQRCLTPFPILNQSVVPCLVLTLASWSTYRFLRRQVRWSGTPISNNFPVCCDPHNQRCLCSQSSRSRFFLELPCFIYDPMSLISGSSTFSKPSLCIRKFSVPILLKPSLKDFEHNLTNIQNE